MISNSRNELRHPNEFLNPKSMVTPGGAGAIIMLVANSLSVFLGFPPEITVIVMSLLFGLLVVLPYSASMIHKSLLFIFNSLIVFSIAVGTMTVGVEAVGTPAPEDPSEVAMGNSRVQANYRQPDEKLVNAQFHHPIMIRTTRFAISKPTIDEQQRRFWKPWKFNPP